jgi:ABC-type glycerol-3-phosphate transport system substrate-binding protein
MRKLKKVANVCMATILGASALFSVVACSSQETYINDGKTVNIKLYSAGYGTEYIYALKEKFEAAYKDEGYKLNIFTPRAGFTGALFLQDIAAGTGADVYFGSSVTEELLNDPAYANTVADITDLVANKKPINFNGEEEGSKTIAEKLAETTYGYTDYKKTDGTYYSIPYNQGLRGLAVNTAVLEEYDLEIPKTSKEFFHCYDVIMAQAKETGVFPITHIATSNNYPASFTNAWLAQYEGYNWYKKFFSFENADGTQLSKDEAVEMFNADGVEYMLENMFHALDPNCGTYGSASQGLEKAQAKFMNGSCAFMMNGDWMLQETYVSFTDVERGDITFVNVPVISELGVKIFGSGTAYNKAEAECETILRAIIDEVDANKALADIKTAVDAKLSMSIAVEDIKAIAEARGYAYAETTSSNVIISEKSQVKDIAALLLRMCASTDGGALIAEKTYSMNPFVESYQNSRYEWVNGARNIVANQYFQSLRPASKGYRKSLGADFDNIFPYTGLYVNLKIIAQGVSIYNKTTLQKTGAETIYSTSAQAMQKSIFEDARDNYNSKW